MKISGLCFTNPVWRCIFKVREHGEGGGFLGLRSVLMMAQISAQSRWLRAAPTQSSKNTSSWTRNGRQIFPSVQLVSLLHCLRVHSVKPISQRRLCLCYFFVCVRVCQLFKDRLARRSLTILMCNAFGVVQMKPVTPTISGMASC